MSVWDEPVPVPMPDADAPLVVQVTGHRPQSFGGTSYTMTPDADWAMERVEMMLVFLKQHAARQGRGVVLVSGMALGVDQWTVAAALRLAIPVHAVVPFPTQAELWHAQAKREYEAILTQCWRITMVRPTGPKNKAQAGTWLTDRNRWMADYVALRAPLACGLAVWNGQPSGTAHAVECLRARKVPLVVIDPVRKWCEVDPSFPGYTPPPA